MGYDLERARQGETLTLTLYWRALRVPVPTMPSPTWPALRDGRAGRGQPMGGDYPYLNQPGG